MHFTVHELIDVAHVEANSVLRWGFAFVLSKRKNRAALMVSQCNTPHTSGTTEIELVSSHEEDVTELQQVVEK